MRLIESLKKKKIILLNVFLSLYIGINLIGGERGLISYFDKKKLFEELEIKEIKAITNKDNVSSKNLLKKLGFKLIGKTILPHEKEELLLFEIKKLK